MKSFKANHKDFYIEFEAWRKNLIQKGSPGGGVYRLVANKPIGRLLKEDPVGILYVGEGDILSSKNRIGKFVNALNGRENRHGAGGRYRTAAIMKKYPLEKAHIEINLTNSHKLAEKEILDQYEKEFGEIPPLNRMGGQG